MMNKIMKTIGDIPTVPIYNFERSIDAIPTYYIKKELRN